MHVGQTAIFSPYTAQAQRNTAASTSSPVADAGSTDQANAGGISTYDFTNMTPAQMQDAMNGLIRSGKMSLDDSSPLVGMIPTALAYAGGGAPSAAQLDAMRNQPMDFLAKLQAGVDFANSRGETHTAEALSRTLQVLQNLQGTPSSVDIVA